MFDLIREFTVLAEHLNFTTAARELGLSQSGLSRHIAALEQELGFALLTRNPVGLTQAGGRYLERVGSIVGAHNALVQGCRCISRQNVPALRLAMADPSSQSALMAYSVFSQMRDEDDSFSYELVSGRSKTIEQLLQESAADVALAYYAPGDGGAITLDDAGRLTDGPDDIVYDFMYNEPLSVWVHELNPLAGHDVTMGDLGACRLVTSSNRMFKTATDGQKAIFERCGIAPEVTTRDVGTLNEFIVTLRRDEVMFTSSFLRSVVSGANPGASEVFLSSGTTIVMPVYLAYRRDCDNAWLGRFISTFRRESLRHQAQVRREMLLD